MAAVVTHSREVVQRIDDAIQAGKRGLEYYNRRCLVVLRWSLIGGGVTTVVGSLANALYFKEELSPLDLMVGGVVLGTISCLGGCCMYKLSRSLWNARKAKAEQDFLEQQTRKAVFDALDITIENCENIQSNASAITEQTHLLGQQNTGLYTGVQNLRSINQRVDDTFQRNGDTTNFRVIVQAAQDQLLRGQHSLAQSTKDHEKNNN